MNKRLINFIGFCVVTYVVLYFVSSQLANFVLALFLVLLIPGLILRYFFMDALYKGSIRIVPKRFVFNQYTIYNEICTVKYTPDEKLVVIDNVANRKREKRTFSLTKANHVNVNKCWNQVCRIFDSFVSLDSLVSFFSYDTKVEVVTIKSKVEIDESLKGKSLDNDQKTKGMTIDASNNGPKFVDIDNIQPDTYSLGLNHQREYDAKFVDIDKMKEPTKSNERDIPAPEFVDMDDALEFGPNKKIDVNTASASEISILPGINIVKAKKIVEYREANGLFKDEDAFIKVAEVKDHFVSKIKKMIVVHKVEKKKVSGDDDDGGRIVDI